MSLVTRRTFLGSTAAGLAATQVAVAAASPAQQLAATAPDRPTNLMATWQRDPTTTMTLQWIGASDEAVDTRIHFRAAGTAANEAWQSHPTAQRPYPLSKLTLYRLELTALRPGVDYEFRIGAQPQIYRFRTMPARATNTISFISGGDCGVNEFAIANNRQAARQDPQFAVIGGDIAYDDGKALDTNLAFLQNYSQHMVADRGRLIPVIACLGNHEVQGGYGQPRAKAPFFYALFEGLFPERGYATLDFGDYLSLVLLDTGHTSSIGGEQTDWLARVLAQRKDHPHVMVVNHVPAYPSYRPMSTANGHAGTGAENRRHWVPLFEQQRVPVVLEHHEHTFKRSKTLLGGAADKNGVLYLGDGSWGKLRPPQKPEKLPHLAVTSQDYHLTLHRLEGDQRIHLALSDEGRVMDVCLSGQRLSGAVAVP